MDQSTNNGWVEALECADATVNKAQLGKDMLSNHRDVPPSSELGVNPNAQIAYMGDPSQKRALKAEARR